MQLKLWKDNTLQGSGERQFDGYKLYQTAAQIQQLAM